MVRAEAHALPERREQTMQPPKLYRTQAELCVRQAEHAKSPQHRVTLLDMAQTWLRMADEAEMMQNLARTNVLDKAS